MLNLVAAVSWREGAGKEKNGKRYLIIWLQAERIVCSPWWRGKHQCLMPLFFSRLLAFVRSFDAQPSHKLFFFPAASALCCLASVAIPGAQHQMRRKWVQVRVISVRADCKRAVCMCVMRWYWEQAEDHISLIGPSIRFRRPRQTKNR